MLRYLLAWLPMLALAIANGAVRQFTYGKSLPELHAHQLSTLTGAAVIGLYIWFVIRAWPPDSITEALQIGLVWVALTVIFEFVMGLVLAHRPLAVVLRDYNLAQGRVWVLLLAWIASAPVLFSWLRASSRPIH